MQQFTLERLKYFPHVAWTLIISFSLFTAHLAHRLIVFADSLVLQLVCRPTLFFDTLPLYV